MPQSADDKAAFEASLVNFKLLADSTVRVTFDVEPVAAPAFLQVFNQRGDPAFLVRASTIETTSESEPQASSNPIIESAASNATPTSNERHPVRETQNERAPIPKERANNGPYSRESRLLHQSPFFYQLNVWRAVGSDQEFQAWCREKPCAICTQAGQQSGQPVIFAHVRRAANAGTGIKPLYSGHPCCNEHHRQQHQHGELYVYQSVYKKTYEGTNLDTAKAWYEKMAVGYAYRWCRDVLKDALGYEHWYDVPPSLLLQWAQNKGVEQHLPKEYRDA